MLLLHRQAEWRVQCCVGCAVLLGTAVAPRTDLSYCCLAKDPLQIRVLRDKRGTSLRSEGAMHAMRAALGRQSRIEAEAVYLPRNLGRSGPYHSMAALLRTLVCREHEGQQGTKLNQHRWTKAGEQVSPAQRALHALTAHKRLKYM